MNKESTTRLSRVVFDTQGLNNPLVLKTIKLDRFEKEFSQWQNRSNFSKQEFMMNACVFVIVTKNLRELVINSKLDAIAKTARSLLKNYLGNTSADYVSYCHRPQIRPVFSPKDEYIGFKLSAKLHKKLKSQFKACNEKLQEENRLIDQLFRVDASGILDDHTGRSWNTKANRLLFELCQPNQKSQRRIQKLIQKVQLLQIIENYLENESPSFDSVDELIHFIELNYDVGRFSRSFLYSIPKQRGLRFKTVKVRTNKSNENKTTRIQFFDRYLDFLKDSKTECLYFD